MSAKMEPDEARQLATWAPVVDQVVGEVMSKTKLASAIGGRDDVRQVANLAVLQTIRSPKFTGGRQTAAYLARCVRSAMRRAAAESSLIRVPWRPMAALKGDSPFAEGDGSSESRIACESEALRRKSEVLRSNAKRAMQVVLIDDADKLAQETSGTDRDVSVRAMEVGCDVSDAVERLPASYKAVIGYLYGVCGHQKLDSKQIASRLGIVIGTVRNRACKSRAMLKKTLAESGYEVATTSEGVSNGDG